MQVYDVLYGSRMIHVSRSMFLFSYCIVHRTKHRRLSTNVKVKLWIVTIDVTLKLKTCTIGPVSMSQCHLN